jgi:hypothetical protein
VGVSRIRVTIDRIALAGFDAAQRAALIEGLQGELKRMLADPAVRTAMTSRRTPVVRLGPMTLAPGRTGSRNFGANLGRAIGRRLGR